MAKVDNPFFGLNATGSIGGTLTYMRLKGQNVVRQKVTPANPQTVAQTSQRGHFGNAVSDWQTGGMNQDDIDAWNLYASSSFRKMSGYNLFIRERTNWYKNSGTSDMFSAVAVSSETANSFDVDVNFPVGGTVKIYYGTTKTSQPTAVDMDDDADGTWSDTVDGLAASTTYYFYLTIDDGAVSSPMRTGLYTATTTAA